MRPSDLFLSPDLTEAEARAFLDQLGFRDAARVDEQLQSLASDLAAREALGRIAGDLLPAIAEGPDPDGAVDGLTRYLAVRAGRAMFLDYLGDDPRALHVLATVLAASPLLTDILIRNPEYLHWLVSQVERSAPDQQDLEDDVGTMLATIHEPNEALEVIKRWNRREMLRIATCDLLRRETVTTIAGQLSDLTSVTVMCALAVATEQVLSAAALEALPGRFAVIAAGRLGGRELYYGAPIQLMCVFDAGGPDSRSSAQLFEKLADLMKAALTSSTAEGDLYVVETLPRAFSESGPAARSLAEYRGSYRSNGSTVDRLALIKARPVAGDPELGSRFVAAAQRFVFRDDLDAAALADLRTVASEADASTLACVELFAQQRQLAYGGRNVTLRKPDTLSALESLAGAGIIAEPVARELSRAYEFLRAVEQRLQIVQDAPSTEPPSDGPGLGRLGLGPPESLQKQLDLYRSRVSELCRLPLDRSSGAPTPLSRGDHR